MTIPAQGGVLGYALQPSKVGEGGTFDANALTWYKIRAPRIDMGTYQDQQVFPLEIGGAIVPTGAYKQGVYGAGMIDLIPRMENVFGWLAKATMGAASTTTGVDADAVAVTGLNTHIFRFNPTNSFDQPWIAVRRMIPGITPSYNFGETVFDAKINGVQFIIPQAGKIAARVSFVGRDVEFEKNPSWTFSNATYEDSDTTVDAGSGQFKIGGIEYPLMGATIEIANNLTTPQQERIIGSFRPDDFVALNRTATIRIVYKYENSDLYQKLLGDDANATEWSPLPFTNDTNGSGHAFDARFEAPINVPGASPNRKYRLSVRANRVTWAIEGTPQLQAGNIVTQTFVGTVLEPANGDYLQIVVENDVASY